MCSLLHLHSFQIHRRILKDDKRGVSEALNEPGQYGDGLIVRGKHYVVFDNYTSSTYIHRIVAEMMMLEPELAFDESTSSFDDLKSHYNLQVSIMIIVFIKLLTLRVCTRMIMFKMFEDVKICLKLSRRLGVVSRLLRWWRIVSIVCMC